MNETEKLNQEMQSVRISSFTEILSVGLSGAYFQGR